MKHQKPTPLTMAIVALSGVGMSLDNTNEQKTILTIIRMLEKIEEEYEPDYNKSLENYLRNKIEEENKKHLRFIKFSNN